VSKRKLAVIILSIALVLVTADALTTNWMMGKILPEYLDTFELNPIMAKLAGTHWLVVVKAGWVLLCLVAVLLIKDRPLKFRKTK
jgi:hypothetical protein